MKQFVAETTLVTYHSKFCSDTSIKTFAGVGVCPIRTDIPGSAPKFTGEGEDIIDEALTFFRAQVFFKNYEP